MQRWHWLLVIIGAAAVWALLGPSVGVFPCQHPLLLPTPMTFCSTLGRTDSYRTCADALGMPKHLQEIWMHSNETDRDVDMFLHFRHTFPSYCYRDHRDLLVQWEKRGYRALQWTWTPHKGFHFVHLLF